MGIKIYKLKKCCFCVELKLGALIIGIVDLVLSILGVLGGFVGLNFIAGGGTGAFGIVWLIFNILHIIACALLIYAAVKSKKKFCLPWMITVIIKILLLIIAMILMCVYHIYAFGLVYFIICIVLLVYFWLCIFAFFASIGGQLPVE